jgi:hypothetical protein
MPAKGEYSANTAVTCPPNRALIAGAPPVYWTYINSMLAARLSISNQMCCAAPGPTLAHAGIILATSSLAAAADSVLELVEFLGDGV